MMLPPNKICHCLKYYRTPFTSDATVHKIPYKPHPHNPHPSFTLIHEHAPMCNYWLDDGATNRTHTLTKK